MHSFLLLLFSVYSCLKKDMEKEREKSKYKMTNATMQVMLLSHN